MFLIFGAGGLAHELYWYLKDCGIKLDGVAVNKEFFKAGAKFMGLPMYCLEELDVLEHTYYRAFGETHCKSFDVLNLGGAIHPTAYVAGEITMGQGCIVCPHAIVIGKVRLGRNVFVNTNAGVYNNVDVGDNTYIAPNVVLAESVKVGKNCFLGVGAKVRPFQKIGDNAYIGIGSIVVKDVPDGEIWVGNPAKKLVKK